MMKYAKPFAFTFVILALVVTACNDNPFEAEQLEVQEFEAPAAQETEDWTLLEDAVIEGRQIRNLQLPLVEGEEFTGRITNLRLTEGPENTVLASGRIIGRVNGERVNETFENIALQVFELDEDGNLIDPNGNEVCPILFLELGPIFLDVLGLQVIVPDPIVVIIQAVPGPGQLLGNLLCALLGILG